MIDKININVKVIMIINYTSRIENIPYARMNTPASMIAFDNNPISNIYVDSIIFNFYFVCLLFYSL